MQQYWEVGVWLDHKSPTFMYRLMSLLFVLLARTNYTEVTATLPLCGDTARVPLADADTSLLDLQLPKLRERRCSFINSSRQM